MTTDELRPKFEAHFTRPPYEWEFVRLSATSAWPDMYSPYYMQCAWEGWQAAHASRDAEVEALRRQVDDLVALVRRLAHSLDKPSGNTLLARQASDYLRRHDLQGTPMREESK